VGEDLGFTGRKTGDSLLTTVLRCLRALGVKQEGPERSCFKPSSFYPDEMMPSSPSKAL